MSIIFPVEDVIVGTFDNPPTENPLSQGGLWARASSQPPLMAVGGAAHDSINGDANYSYYTDLPMVDQEYMEAWGCAGGGSLGAAVDTHRVFLWQNVDVMNPRGYLMYFGGGIGEAYVIRRYNGGGITDNENIAASGGTAGNRYGLAIRGDTIEAWARHAGTWVLEVSVVDTTFRGGTWYGGLGCEDPTNGGVFWTCFGAGIDEDMSQIYRRVPGRPR